jgi:dihydropyrimidinase
VHHFCTFLQMTGATGYIVHTSNEPAVGIANHFRGRGLGVDVQVETVIPYLVLDDTYAQKPDFEGAKYVMSPPLRDKHKQEQLWRGLRFNDLQAISTDHCPFCFNENPGKLLGKDDFSKIPNGAPGIETRMSLTYDGGVRSGRISLNRWVELTSTAPAKLFGMFPRKGTIAPGSDADIVIFDPEAQTTISAKTHHMNVDYNPYEGRRVTGVAETVLSRGEVIVSKGAFEGSPGRGTFIKRASRHAS